jgi:hypothetical protein
MGNPILEDPQTWSILSLGAAVLQVLPNAMVYYTKYCTTAHERGSESEEPLSKGKRFQETNIIIYLSHGLAMYNKIQ